MGVIMIVTTYKSWTLNHYRKRGAAAINNRFIFSRHYLILGDVRVPEAIVLINTNIGAEEEVMNELLKIEGISEAYIVYGVYDIVVKIKAPSTETLKEIISSKIRKISNVRSTLTMIVVEGKGSLQAT